MKRAKQNAEGEGVEHVVEAADGLVGGLAGIGQLALHFGALVIDAHGYEVEHLHGLLAGRLHTTKNLLNHRHYAYTIFKGINTYTYDYTLCGRTVMLRATFKL